MEFGEKIKELREEREITQKEVARACDLTPTCICQLESGVRKPTGSTVRLLAEFFGVSADFLLGISEDETAVPVSPAVPQFSENDQALVDAYHTLSPDLQRLLWEQIRLWQRNAEVIGNTKKKNA